MSSTIENNSLSNSFFKFSIGPIVRALISFVTTPIITHLLQPEEFGKASMFVLANGLLLQLGLLGADQSFSRFYYDRKFNKSGLLSNSIIISGTVGLIIATFVFFFRNRITEILIGSNQEPVFITILIITFYLSIFERFGLLLIRMKQKSMLFSYITIIRSLINLFVVILYAKKVSADYYSLIYASLISSFCVFLIEVISERKDWNWNFKANISRDNTTKILKYGLPYVPAFIINWVFEFIDKIALRRFSTFEEIGLYAAAFKIVAVLKIIQLSFTTFWWPVAYENYEKKTQDKGLYIKTFNIISFGFMIVSLIIIVFKDIVIQILSKDFINAATIIPFLLFIPFMYTISEITVVGINFKEKTQWHIVISMISAIVNILGNFILVPRFQAEGAALSTAFSYIVFFTLRTVIANKYYKIPINYYRIYLLIFLLFSNAFVNTFLKNRIINMLIGILSIIIIIFVCLESVKMITSLLFNKLKDIKNAIR